MVKNEKSIFGFSQQPPICFLALFSIILFYTFYLSLPFFKIEILFFVCVLSFFAIALFLLFKKKLICKFKKQTYINIIFSFLGILIGSVSFYRLTIIFSPVLTLAEKSKVETIKAYLTSEPSPAGQKYFAVEAKIISCSYKNAEFSASGNIKIFLPAEMIYQNNAFGKTAYKSTEKTCKNFSKGLILSARGRLVPKRSLTEAESFFVEKEVPLFIGWKSFIANFRASLRFYLMRLLAGWGEAGGLLLALLSANKDFLSAECIGLFRTAGLAHILALSGMHVSLVSLVAIRMGSVFGKKSTSIKLSLLAIIVFVWFAGSAPSLNRALGMMIILIIGKSLGLQPTMLSTLACMLIIHLGLKPSDALSLGFILSYGALAGIIILGEAFYSILNGKIPPKILSGISASIGAQLFTTPVVISKIGAIAPIGIIASIIISPFVSAFLILGIFAVFFSLIIPFTAAGFSFILNKLYTLIILLTKIFASVNPIQAESIGAKILFSVFAITISTALFVYAKILRERKLCIS